MVVRSTLECGGSTPPWLAPSGVIQSGVEPPHSKVLRTAASPVGCADDECRRARPRAPSAFLCRYQRIRVLPKSLNNALCEKLAQSAALRPGGNAELRSAQALSPTGYEPRACGTAWPCAPTVLAGHYRRIRARRRSPGFGVRGYYRSSASRCPACGPGFAWVELCALSSRSNCW